MPDVADIANDALSIEMSALLSARNRKPNSVVECLECEDCGEEIPLRRREAIPGVTRCITCQMEFERSQDHD